VVPNLAAEWAGAMVGLLGLQDLAAAPVMEPVVVVPLEPAQHESDPAVLMDIYREALKSHGAKGIFGLQRKFKIMDDDGSRALSPDEFSKALGEAALSWTPEQHRALFAHFDRDGSGGISFEEFLGAVRGGLSARRKQLVLMAFEVLDADKNGTIEAADIAAKYSAARHPDVLSGRRGEQEVLREFLDTFDDIEQDGKVTYAEFCSYYGTLSASIDHDDYFELMMRNAWHISGGEGWCANSSCRRVLVTHADGKQTVEEIKNDMGISEDDEAALWSNLAAQGLDGITALELSSGKKLLPPSLSSSPESESESTTSEPAVACPDTPSRSGRHRHFSSGASSIVLG
jgi:Ca2+-binding EF-hand superfamily protein